MAEIILKCNKINDSGVISEDYNKIIMIPLPQKTATKKFEDQRTIKHMLQKY